MELPNTHVALNRQNLDSRGMQTTLDNWRRNRTASRRDLEEAQLAQVYDLRVHHGAQARKQNPSSVSLDMRFMPPNSLNEMLKREARRAAAVSETEPAKLVSQQAREIRELVSKLSRSEEEKPRLKKQASGVLGVHDDKKPDIRPSQVEILRPAFAGVGTRALGHGKRKTEKSPVGLAKHPSSPARPSATGADSLTVNHGTRVSRNLSQPDLTSSQSLTLRRLSAGPVEPEDTAQQEEHIDEEARAMELLARVCERKQKEPKSAEVTAKLELAESQDPVTRDPDTMSKRMRMIICLQEEILQAYSMVADEDKAPAMIDEA